MDNEQLQSCSLCYFFGTEQEFKAHTRCALHGFNYTLKYFNDNRSSIVKNRHGIKIDAICKKQNVSLMNNQGTNTITLYRNNIDDNLKVKLIYKITNTQQKENVSVMNILQLHPQHYFKMYHKHQKQELSKNPIVIGPKNMYQVRVEFKQCVKDISTYRMPLGFVFKTKNRQFTLIRELVVVIEDKTSENGSETEKNSNVIYTGKSWAKAEIVPSNIQSDLDKEFLVPKHYRLAISKYLKITKVELRGRDTMQYEKFVRLFGENSLGLHRDNYNFYCSVMMWMEEIVEDHELRKYNMEAVTVSVSKTPMKADVTLEVPGLAEKRPSLVVGDRAQIRLHQDDIKKYKTCKIYEGVISKVLDTAVEIDEFNDEFLKLVTNNTLVDVRFVMSRLRYERMHRALSFHNDFIDRLFPSKDMKIEIIPKAPRASKRIGKRKAMVKSNRFNVLNVKDAAGSGRSSENTTDSSRRSSISSNDQNGSGDKINGMGEDEKRPAVVTNGFDYGSEKENEPQSGDWNVSLSPKKKKQQNKREIRKNKKRITEFTYVNKCIEKNEEQKLAIENIVNNSSGIAPYILFGPPGTGKTVTIVEAIVQILKNFPKSKILVCAPANMACDMLTCKLMRYFDKMELIRVHSLTRDFTVIPKEIYRYSNLDVGDDGNVKDVFPVKSDELSLGSYKIIVCTLMLAGKYTRQVRDGKSELSFTHLVIDEAAQSTETETLIPLGGLLRKDGQLILAGDPKQLGPICQSHIVKGLGLGISLMERLMTTNQLYETRAEVRDARYITKLVKNFRSHPDIIRIPNIFFYDNELQSCSQEALRDPIVAADIMEELAFGGTAIEFYGVCAVESRQGRSPSFFNAMEKNVVMRYIKKLIEQFGNPKKIQPAVKGSDIGVISPYIKQVYKIKSSLQKLGGEYNDIEVGSTEAFQGREKRIMIISTVRGRTDLLEYDKKYNLGFLVDEKRFNVAMTRAKSKLIIVGNPLCLCYNKHWLGYMQECDRLNRYLGYRFKKRNDDIMNEILCNIRQLTIKEVVNDDDGGVVDEKKLEEE